MPVQDISFRSKCFAMPLNKEFPYEHAPTSNCCGGVFVLKDISVFVQQCILRCIHTLAGGGGPAAAAAASAWGAAATGDLGEGGGGSAGQRSTALADPTSSVRNAVSSRPA